MRLYTTSRLSEHQSFTPEGFLFVQDVPIARTGTMVYGPGETTLPAGESGRVLITRDATDVFSANTISSFDSKPFVLDHPSPADADEWTVNPNNFREVCCGVTISPRRGSGSDTDVILADLLIQDAEAIKQVLGGRREVSCGYLADYICEECGDRNNKDTWNKCTCDKPKGRGNQINILGNHVALVDSGRCGSRCSIGDKATISQQESKPMSFIEKLMKALNGDGDVKEAMKEFPAGKKIVLTKDGCSLDAEEEEKKADEVKEAPKGKDRKWEDAAAELEKKHDELKKEVKDGFKRISDELVKIGEKKVSDAKEENKEEEKKENKTREVEGELEEEAPEGTGDKARHAKDSSYLVDSWQETVATAEVLAPGIQIPTFDAKLDPKENVKNICAFRRRVLDLAYGTAEMRGPIDEALAGKTVNGSFTSDKSLTCDAVRGVFRSAGIVKRQMNRTQKSSAMIATSGGGTGVRGVIKTPHDLNERNRAYYSK